MSITIEAIIERAFEQAFLIKKAFKNGSGLSKKLEEKIEQGFQRFVEEGIQWQKKKPGFEN